MISAHQNEINSLKMFSSGKYLVLLQNNAEIRPTGGFIGSFAIIEFSNYKIKKIDFNTNIYKLDQNFTSNHIVTPPVPLAGISNGKWSLRDSNFSIDFPTAAKEIEWFYNQETGDNVDGVIAINASVIANLLKLTGPVNLDNYNLILNSNNFYNELTTQIEKNYYTTSDSRDTNEPKTILKDLFPILVNRLLSVNKITLTKEIYQEIRQKQIIFYSNNQQIEEAILAQNFGGAIRDSASDYLNINNANVSGGKSSLNIAESIDYQVKTQSDKLAANLTVTRTHNGTGVWPDGVNINYMRILVPQSAILISAVLNDKDITSKVESGTVTNKTYFAVTFQTAPGTTDVLKLNYNLGISLLNYQLLLQKQPGNLGDDVKISFNDNVLFNGKLLRDTLLKAVNQ